MGKSQPNPRPAKVPKPKPLTDRQKFVAKRPGQGATGGHWEVRKGIRVWVKD